MTEHCAGCGRDLTYRCNSTDYRLALRSEELPPDPAGGAVTDMILDPPIAAPVYFCALPCLDRWRKTTNAADPDPLSPFGRPPKFRPRP